ncbi:hypothetical protein Tco_0074777, partial [Tanacetum coccineum]
EVKESDRPARSVLTLKPLPKIDPKDKGKVVRKEELEPPKMLKKSDLDAAQLDMDKEYARQAEREQFVVEQRAKFLYDIIAAQRKFLTEQRAVAIRNKPLTKTQQKKSIQDFVPIGSAEDERLIEKMSKKAAGEDTSKKEKVLEEHDSTKMEDKKEEVEESTKKRPGTILKMTRRKKAMKQTHADGDASKKRKGSPRMKRISKRKNTDSDLEKEEHLKNFLKIVPNEEGIVNYEVLEKRYPIINWESKFYYYDRHGAEAIYYKIFRSDG